MSLPGEKSCFLMISRVEVVITTRVYGCLYASLVNMAKKNKLDASNP